MSAITTERNGHVACVEVHEPPNNHVSAPLMRELADAFARLDEETWCRAIVLQSEGKNFCAGADLAAPRGLADANVSPGISDLYVEAVRLFSNKKPIVAAIQGAAVGAGLGLALVADHRVAAADARFTANFVKLGFHPGFGLTCTLPRVIGSQRASLMFLTGRRLKPQEALDWGLIDAVVPEADLRVEALKLAAEIAENAPLAVQSTRATLRAGLAEAVKAQTDVEFREQSWLRATKDFAEGVRAVAERRPGNFVSA